MCSPLSTSPAQGSNIASVLTWTWAFSPRFNTSLKGWFKPSLGSNDPLFLWKASVTDELWGSFSTVWVLVLPDSTLHSQVLAGVQQNQTRHFWEKALVARAATNESCKSQQGFVSSLLRLVNAEHESKVWWPSREERCSATVSWGDYLPAPDLCSNDRFVLHTDRS